MKYLFLLLHLVVYCTWQIAQSWKYEETLLLGLPLGSLWTHPPLCECSEDATSALNAPDDPLKTPPATACAHLHLSGPPLDGFLSSRVPFCIPVLTHRPPALGLDVRLLAVWKEIFAYLAVKIICKPST